MKILKEGKPKNYIKCAFCECEFIYETDDVQVFTHAAPHPYKITYVKCPWCERRISID